MKLQLLPLRGLVACVGVLGLAGLAGAADAEKKPATITVLLPESRYAPAELKIENQPTKQTGDKREFVTPPLEPGKVYSYSVQAMIQPNNYTKIYRTREVTFKAGDTITVDLRQKSPKTDKIVVRWVPTPDDIVDEMAKLAKVGKNDIVYDLGCGDAVMLIRAVKNFHAKKGVGIDIDAKMVKVAQEKAADAGVADKVEVRKGDILDVKDMSDATVVMLYIGDDLGERLGPVLQKTLKPGARVVSHRFVLGDWKPTKTVMINGTDGGEYTLHLWVVGDKGGKKESKEDKKQ